MAGLEEKVGLQKAMLVVPLMYLLVRGGLLLCGEGPGHREAGTGRQVHAVINRYQETSCNYLLAYAIPSGSRPAARTWNPAKGNASTGLSNRLSKSTLQSIVDTSQIQLQASRHKLQDQHGAVLPGL